MYIIICFLLLLLLMIFYIKAASHAEVSDQYKEQKYEYTVIVQLSEQQIIFKLYANYIYKSITDLFYCAKTIKTTGKMLMVHCDNLYMEIPVDNICYIEMEVREKKQSK